MACKRYLIAWLLGLWWLTFPMESFGAAWILEPGEYEAEFFLQRFEANEDYDASGHRRRKPNGGEFHEWRYELKLEASIPPSWHPTATSVLRNVNFLLAVPYESARFRDRNVSLGTSGAEEIRFGVKYLLLSEPIALSAIGSGKFPVCDKRDQPPLADCQIDEEVRLLISRAFWPQQVPVRGSPEPISFSRLYANFEIGYRFRAEALADEIPYVLEVGYFPWMRSRTRVLVKGGLDGVASKPFGGRGAEEDFVKWTASARLELGDLLYREDSSGRHQSMDPTRLRRTPGFELGYSSVFAGKNTGAGQSVFVKVFFRY